MGAPRNWVFCVGAPIKGTGCFGVFFGATFMEPPASQCFHETQVEKLGAAGGSVSSCLAPGAPSMIPDSRSGGLPKFGVGKIRIIILWGLYVGPPILGNSRFRVRVEQLSLRRYNCHTHSPTSRHQLAGSALCQHSIMLYKV